MFFWSHSVSLRISVMLLMVCLLLLIVANRTYANDDENMFVTLFENVNAVVTPKFEGVESYGMPSEIFLMQLPGQTIDPDDFDYDVWKANGFEDSDPEYNAFLLSDSIPVSNTPYYIDSGKKISNMYKRFLENYITIPSKTQTPEEVAAYKAALKKIMKEDFTPSPLAISVNDTRNVARQNYARITNLRNDCLASTNYGICAQKAVYWMEGQQDDHVLYMVTQKQLLAAQAKVLSLQFRSFDLLLMQAYERLMGSFRSSVGAKSFLGDYFQTRYEPSDFWKWWRDNTTASSFNSGFTEVSMYSDSKYKTESESFSKTSWSTKMSFKFLFISFSKSMSGSSSSQSSSVNEGGSSTTITFEVGAVKINRPWFDASLFDLSPLGIKGAPKKYWSNGKFEGTFPWFTSKFVVAKNIVVSKSSWSSSLTEKIEKTSFEVTTSLGIGPFSFGGSYSKDTEKRDAAKQFKFDGSSLTMKGPQIIGYVMTKLPPFPNYDDGDFNLKVID